MILGIPLFFLFCIYGVVNTYLPVFLSTLGYSVPEIGLLMGCFEAAGLSIPVLVSSRVDKKGTHGRTVILLCVLIILVLPPLVLIRHFLVTAIFLGLLAVGFKGSVPLLDVLISRDLGDDTSNYGEIRVIGSIGFVFVALLLQFTSMVNPDSARSIASAIIVPSLLVIISMITIPKLLKRNPAPSIPEVETGFIRRCREQLGHFPPAFWFGIFLIFLGFLGLTPSQRFFSLYVRDYLGMESYAGLWALSAAAEIPFMFFSGFFIRKYGTEKLLVVSLVAITVRNLVYALFPTFGGAVAGQLFHSVCFGLFHPAAVVFISERVPRRFLAVGLTLYTSFSMGLASVIGNVMGGFVIDWFGYRVLFVFFSFFPLIGIASFMYLRNVLFRKIQAN